MIDVKPSHLPRPRVLELYSMRDSPVDAASGKDDRRYFQWPIACAVFLMFPSIKQGCVNAMLLSHARQRRCCQMITAKLAEVRRDLLPPDSDRAPGKSVIGENSVDPYHQSHSSTTNVNVTVSPLF